MLRVSIAASLGGGSDRWQWLLLVALYISLQITDGSNPYSKTLQFFGHLIDRVNCLRARFIQAAQQSEYRILAGSGSEWIDGDRRIREALS